MRKAEIEAGGIITLVCGRKMLPAIHESIRLRPTRLYKEYVEISKIPLPI